MDVISKYATAEDVICAMEIVLGQENIDILKSDLFGLNISLAFVNIGCILETDHVITSGSHLEIAILLISYIFTPEKLVIYNGDSKVSPGMDNIRKEIICQLLTGYKYTEPVISNWKEFPEDWQGTFDVAIVSSVNQIHDLNKVPIDRFFLDRGMEYVIFEKKLTKYGKRLKKDGRLVILAKPGWVLMLWTLIHDLGLQLEYEDYSLYINYNRHPNVFIWLRFVKKDDFNLELHKRNILSILKDNHIDRLYAHRNQLIFPYVEMSYTNSESYVKLNQNMEYMQYFFSIETTVKLSQLCVGYTACLVTPSIAQYAYKSDKNIVLFERDNRFRENGGLKFVKYDLYIGLTKLLRNRYANKFDRVICDPPFDIKLDTLANDILELLKPAEESIVYVVFPNSRKISLINMMKYKGLLYVEETEKISIEYAKTPKIVRMNGKDAIQLYKFNYISLIT